MIFTERKITVRKGKSSIDEPVILYRGDYEVELRFTIMESKYRFKSGVNLVDSEKASHAQLALLAPDGANVFTEVGRCEDGTAIFVLSKEMIDELSEVGLYSFQIRLFDYYQESRITIPPIEFGIEVREPIAAEDHINVVDDAMVGYSIAKTSVLDEPVPETFDTNGQYNKTDWETGDRISEGKLNKIEDALDQINQNEINDVVALNRKVDSNYNVLDVKINSTNDALDSKINEVAEKGTTVDVLEKTTKNELERMIDDGTIANLTIADNSITTEKYKDESITNSKVKGLNFYKVNTVIDAIVEDVIMSANETNIFCKDASDVGRITYENGAFYYTGGNSSWDSPIIRSEKATVLTFTRGQNYQVYLGENVTGITTLTIGTSPSYISNRSEEGNMRIMDIPNSSMLSLGSVIKVEVNPINKNHITVFKLKNDVYTPVYEFDIPEEAFCYDNANLGLMVHKVNDPDDKMVYKDIELGVSSVEDSIWDIVEPRVQDEVDDIISSTVYSFGAGFNTEYTYMYSDDFNTGDNDNVEVTSDGSIYYRGDYSTNNMPSVMFDSGTITVVIGDCWHFTLGGSNDGYTTMNMKTGSLSNRKLTTTSGTTIQQAGDLQGATGDSITITRDGIHYIVTNNTKNVTLEFDLDTKAYACVAPGIGLLCHHTGDNNKNKPKYTNILFNVEILNTNLEEMILNSVRNNITIDNSGISTSSIWAGKKWVTLGDSITARNHYQEMYNEVLKCRTVVNYGVGGTCIAKKNANDTTAMCVRYANMDDDADLVTVWGGVNDFGGGQFGHPAGIPMGDIDSTELTTFYGAMKALVAGLQAKYLTAKIAFIITPPINGSKSLSYSGNNRANSQGHYLREYCEVVKEICELNSIPYIDMYQLSGFNDSNIHIMTATKDQSSPDGLHPSLVGFEYMQNKIVTFLNSL